ncbi:sigma-w pathway protein ysdB, partial [Bacillus atrophaeus]|uniref:sigma-w pathway protein ysdB n=2 Tax=Bacillus atrophaeus TaxID=1452 RepID=UPI00227EE452
MIIIILRLALLALLAYCIYVAVRFYTNPKRRLKLAQSKEHFYIVDEQKNARKNFQLTYKGVLFEGEKHIPSKDHPLFIHTIFVWTESPEKLAAFSAKDFKDIEQKVNERYPDCKIDW